ncbi:MAG: Nudix family hydrolase [Thiobacillaceae bacterium]
MSQAGEVVAAILCRPDGKVFLASRPNGKIYAGYWEFPGGKVETGESLSKAFTRELKEELGIVPTRYSRSITRVFTYPHATVRLNFFRVWQWHGEPYPHEGQTFAWVDPARCEVAPLLPANFPVLKGLSLPPVYGISHAQSLGLETFLERLDVALDKGLRLIQLRDKDLPPAKRVELAHRIVERAQPYGAIVLVSGDVNLANQTGAHGIHLDSAALVDMTQRPAVQWVGASCHNADQLAKAGELADFALLSPVLPTASHPGEPSLGWQRFSELAATSPIPVYALGGQTPDTLEAAILHGGHGIAMLREVWR